MVVLRNTCWGSAIKPLRQKRVSWTGIWQGFMVPKNFLDLPSCAENFKWMNALNYHLRCIHKVAWLKQCLIIRPVEQGNRRTPLLYGLLFWFIKIMDWFVSFFAHQNVSGFFPDQTKCMQDNDVIYFYNSIFKLSVRMLLVTSLWKHAINLSSPCIYSAI